MCGCAIFLREKTLHLCNFNHFCVIGSHIFSVFQREQWTV